MSPLFYFLLAGLEQHRKWERVVSWFGIVAPQSLKVNSRSGSVCLLGEMIPIRSVCVERGWKRFYDVLLATERKCALGRDKDRVKNTRVSRLGLLATHCERKNKPDPRWWWDCAGVLEARL